jgi:TatD DNase family protein
VLALAEQYENFYATVGIHPDYEDIPEFTVEELINLAQHPKVVGIGETGLDYFRLTGDLEWQRDRFRKHIHAAKQVKKPLIIHTRSAAKDTIQIMQQEGADEVAGVMHCFTESYEVAKQAMDLGFYISISGIVTFKNAADLREVVRQVPLERLLIETDSPYLAPVPYRGKTNQPAFVKYVAEEIAKIKGISLEEVAQTTTNNFFRLFLPHSTPV